MAKPPSPKPAQNNKAMGPCIGISASNVGFELSESGRVRIYGKRDGVQKVAEMTVDEFVEILWRYLNEEGGES